MGNAAATPRLGKVLGRSWESRGTAPQRRHRLDRLMGLAALPVVCRIGAARQPQHPTRMLRVAAPRKWRGELSLLRPTPTAEPFGQFARLPLTFGSFLARIVDAGSPGLADEAHPSTLLDVSRGPYSLHCREHGGRRAQLSAIS